MLAFDQIWLVNSRLMTPLRKPLMPTSIHRHNKMAEGIINFVAPWDSSGVAIDIVTGQCGRSGLTNSVRYAKGNVVAAYVQYGLNRQGTSAANSYANALIRIPDSAGPGFSYASRIHFRKDYTSVSSVADYAFRLAGTNLGITYHVIASNAAAPNSIPQHRIDSSIQTTGAPTGLLPGSTCDFAVTVQGTGGVHFHRYNESFYAARQTTTLGGDETSMYIYSLNDTTNDQPEIEYIAVWNRAIPESMMWDFLKNPYQVLI